MNERLKQLRDHLELTQEEFGKRIGSARNTIANYETGNRVPSNAILLSICREFNVNETWLRTGNGEMFNEMDSMDIVFNRFGHIMGNASTQKKAVLAALVEMMYYFPDDKWDYVYKQFENCLNEAHNKPGEG
ncbi:helix-turn-helix domain-containing protein [[Clostridium] symbiosum]|uniref:helix-turn-helix domain-containing protein n=1 Tax=Clostridium symbiosum TaxID=1512 RepID=UPI0034A39547